MRTRSGKNTARENDTQKDCIIQNDRVICPENMNDVDSVSYNARKTQVSGKDDKYIQEDGIEYDATKPMIRELFDERVLSQDVHTSSGVERVRKSYMYVISKVIDSRTFIKIGISRISNTSVSTRLGFLHTALIPGLKNIGFKLHYLFFYGYESKEKGSTFAENIEKDLHKVLQNHKQYKKTVIKFPSSNFSEWYLPNSKKSKEFMDFVVSYVSVQKPFPEEAYHFYVKNEKDTKETNEEFIKEGTKAMVRNFRKDYVKLKGEILKKYQLTKKETDLKRGSKQYFLRKLVNRDISSSFEVHDIYYHKQATDELRTFQSYYCLVVNKVEPTSKPNMFIDFTETKQGQINYYSHIRNVLEKLYLEDRLDELDLRSNYNHYFESPLNDIRKVLDSVTIESKITFDRSKVEWCIGRYLRDKDDDVFVVKEFTTKPNNPRKVKTINVAKVTDSLKPIMPEKIVKARPLIVLRLILDFHDDKIPEYSVLDSSKEIVKKPINTKYKKHDFIKFRSKYFKDENTGKNIQERYIGIILQSYYDYDDESNYVMFYDILFENELWKLETKSVDRHSDLLNSVKQKKDFLLRCRKEKALIKKLLEQYDITNSSGFSGISSPRRKKAVNKTRKKSLRKRKNNQISRRSTRKRKTIKSYSPS